MLLHVVLMDLEGFLYLRFNGMNVVEKLKRATSWKICFDD